MWSLEWFRLLGLSKALRWVEEGCVKAGISPWGLLTALGPRKEVDESYSQGLAWVLVAITLDSPR